MRRGEEGERILEDISLAFHQRQVISVDGLPLYREVLYTFSHLLVQYNLFPVEAILRKLNCAQ
jgi:hypothetical protein